MIVMHSNQSCAIQEISGIAAIDNYVTSKDPKARLGCEAAMADFCNQNLVKPVRYKGLGFSGASGGDPGAPGKLYSFYLFSSACSGSGKDNNYGVKFKSYLEDFGLGKVWESPALINHAYHSSHANQVFVWEPDLSAVKTWWKVYQKDGHVKP